jgi:hypothetical protein
MWLSDLWYELNLKLDNIKWILLSMYRFKIKYNFSVNYIKSWFDWADCNASHIRDANSLLFPSVASFPALISSRRTIKCTYLQSWIGRWLWVMIWKGYRKKQLWPISMYYPGIRLKGLRKPRKPSVSVSVSWPRFEPITSKMQGDSGCMLWFCPALWWREMNIECI